MTTFNNEEEPYITSTPPDILTEARTACDSLLPSISKDRYITTVLHIMPQVTCRVTSDVDIINYIINDVLAKSEKKNSELIKIQKEQTQNYNPTEKNNLENDFGLYTKDFKESEASSTPGNNNGVDFEATEKTEPKGIFDKKLSPFLRSEKKLTTCLKLRDIILDFHKIFSETLNNFQDNPDSNTRKPETENHASGFKTAHFYLSPMPDKLEKHSTEYEAESNTKPLTWATTSPAKKDYIYKAISLASVEETAKLFNFGRTKPTTIKPFTNPYTQVSDLLEMTNEHDTRMATSSILDRIQAEEKALKLKIANNFSYFDDYGNIKKFIKLKQANKQKEMNKLYQSPNNKLNSERLNDLADELTFKNAITITNNNGQGVETAFTTFRTDKHAHNKIDLRLLEQDMKAKKGLIAQLAKLTFTMSPPKVNPISTRKIKVNKFVTMPLVTRGVLMKTRSIPNNITTRSIKTFDEKISGRKTECKGAHKTDAKSLANNDLEQTVTISQCKKPEKDVHFFKKLLAKNENITAKKESTRAHVKERYSWFSSKNYKTTSPYSEITEKTSKTTENQELNGLYKKIMQKYDGIKKNKVDNDNGFNFFNTGSPQKVAISTQRVTDNVKEDINEVNKQKYKYYNLEDMSKEFIVSEIKPALQSKAQTKTIKLDKVVDNIENLPDVVGSNNMQATLTGTHIYQKPTNHHENTLNYEDKHQSPITEAINHHDSNTKQVHHGILSENLIDAIYKENMKKPDTRLKDSDNYQSTINNHENIINHGGEHQSPITKASNRHDSKTKIVHHEKLSENSIHALYKEIIESKKLKNELNVLEDNLAKNSIHVLYKEIMKEPKELKNELKVLEDYLAKNTRLSINKATNLPDYRHTQQNLAIQRKEMEDMLKEVMKTSETTPNTGMTFERFHTQKSKTEHSTIKKNFTPDTNVNTEKVEKMTEKVETITEKGETITEKNNQAPNPINIKDSKVSEKNSYTVWSTDEVTNLPDYENTQKQNLAIHTKQMENMLKEVMTTSATPSKVDIELKRYHTHKSNSELGTTGDNLTPVANINSEKKEPSYNPINSKDSKVSEENNYEVKADTETNPKRIHERIFKHFKWDRIKKLFGHDRVCNCKCRVNRTMCRACAASDEVMRELIFEFNNMEEYMKRHCTEIQTFFWMNPSGGKKLRDSVHRIDRSMQDYYKRVRGKCNGRTCKTFATYLDKRSSTAEWNTNSRNSSVGFRSVYLR